MHWLSDGSCIANDAVCVVLCAIETPRRVPTQPQRRAVYDGKPKRANEGTATEASALCSDFPSLQNNPLWDSLLGVPNEAYSALVGTLDDRSERWGIDSIVEYARIFGLDRPTGFTVLIVVVASLHKPSVASRQRRFVLTFRQRLQLRGGGNYRD